MNRSVPLRTRTRLQRRTGLTATTGLSRKPWNVLRAAQKPRKAPRETGFPAAVKKAVRERAGHRCEACGVPLPSGFGNVQHRVARKMGGRRTPLHNSVVNGVLLCGTTATGDHGLAEARDPHMHEAGFWLEEHQNPLEEPILLHGEFGGVRKWLTPDGGYSDYSPIARGEAA